MNSTNSALLIIFGIVAYMIIVDKNVGEYLTLIFKISQINIERFFWMVKYHPKNFLTTWIQNRKYDKIARELEKEFLEKKTNDI